MECYREAVRLQPTYAKAWYNMGYILDKQGNYQESIECFKKALELAPENEKYLDSLSAVESKWKEFCEVFDNSNEMEGKVELKIEGKFELKINEPQPISISQRPLILSDSSFDTGHEKKEIEIVKLSSKSSPTQIQEISAKEIEVKSKKKSVSSNLLQQKSIVDNISNEPAISDHSSPEIINRSSLNQSPTNLEDDENNDLVIPIYLEAVQNELEKTNTIEDVKKLQNYLKNIMQVVQTKLTFLKSQKSNQLIQNLCVVCRENQVEMICIPCGHLCLCQNCKSKLLRKKCPICAQNVKNIYKVFK